MLALKTILKAIVAFIAFAIIVVVLGLIPVYTRSNGISATTIPTATTTTIATTTTTTTTIATTTETSTTTQRIITQCQSVVADVNERKKQSPKSKMIPISNVVDDRILVKDSYLVEFASDSGVTNPFRTISTSLKSSHNIPQSAIKLRQTIESDLFSGVSFSLTGNHSVEALESIEEVIAIYPIYIVPRPRSMSTNISYNTNTDLTNSHNLTGVSQVHQELHRFGKGVRVSVHVCVCAQLSVELILFYIGGYY